MVHKSGLGILDVVPTYNSLAVYFDPLDLSPDELTITVNRIIEENLTLSRDAPAEPNAETVVHKVPVVYNGADLERIAELNLLQVDEVIELHLKPHYTIAMIGFLPHYPYLIGLDPKLATPRLDTPRNRVAAGTIAIGGIQAGIYPQESPGGWNLVGITDPELLKSMNPGDTIIFQQVGRL